MSEETPRQRADRVRERHERLGCDCECDTCLLARDVIALTEDHECQTCIDREQAEAKLLRALVEKHAREWKIMPKDGTPAWWIREGYNSAEAALREAGLWMEAPK